MRKQSPMSQKAKFLPKAMVRALEMAVLGSRQGEIPVGAVVVRGEEILSEAHNLKETTNISTHHAEILAIERACVALGRWRLNDCDLYVTLEPCVMCAGAIVQARLASVYFGALDPKAGAVQSVYKILSDPRLNHQSQIEMGLMAQESERLLKDFFSSLRDT